MKLRTQLMLGYLLVLGLMLVTASISYKGLSSQTDTTRWVAHTHEVIGDVHLIEKLLSDMETGQRGFLLTGEEEFLEPYYAGKQELEVALAAAQEATRVKTEFLNNMSHELRTPLNSILGFSRRILKRLKGSIPDRDSTALEAVVRNAQHLHDLINDLLDMAKIESGKLIAEFVRCSPPEIIADVASMLHEQATSKGISLDIQYDGPIPQFIRTDPTRLRQILINLMGNAIKFTEAGHVELVARLLPIGSDGPKLQIEVRDSGIGMDNQQMAHIFQPFVQADASTARKFGGTGLGLAISKRYAELLAGDLQAESTLGEGSTFTLTLPTGPLQGVSMIAEPRAPEL